MNAFIKQAEDALVTVLTKNPQLRDDLFPVIEAMRVCALEKKAYDELCTVLLELGFRVDRRQVRMSGLPLYDEERSLYFKQEEIYKETANKYKTSAIANALFRARYIQHL